MARASDGRSSLSRHLQILEAFSVDTPYLTVSQLSRRTGLALATVHRLVTELQEHQLLERRDDKTYRLGILLWELACRTPGALGVREIAMPHIQEVHALVRQHTQLGVLAGHEVLFLERLSTREAVVNITLVGGRLPLNASSSGLVLLAHSTPEFQDDVLASDLQRFTDKTVHEPRELRRLLRRIRVEGYAVGDGYIHPDARGIAVPVFGANHTVVAALSVIVPNDDEPAAPKIELLRAASAQISEAMHAAYLPSGHPQAVPGGRLRPLVSSSVRSMEYLSTTYRAPADLH